MKKGLLSFLLAALTLVGCQNYDDQFDELNAKILALQSELSSIDAITSAINDLNTKIAAVQSSALTAADLAGIISDLDAVQAAVANLGSVGTEVENLNAEVDEILAALDDLLAANAVINQDLRITTDAELRYVASLVNLDPTPTVIVNGFVEVDPTFAATNTAKIDSILAITNKINTILGNTADKGLTTAGTGLTFNELSFLDADMNIAGGVVALPKLVTVGGDITLNYAGNYSFPLISRAATITLTDNAGLTAVDFSGLTTANSIQSAAGILSLAKATSVKLGSIALPVSITLPLATEFTTLKDGAQGGFHAAIGGSVTATALAIDMSKMTSLSGAVTLTTGGTSLTTVNLGSVASHAAGLTMSSNGSINLGSLAGNGFASSITSPDVNLDSLATNSGTLALTEVACSLPALASATAAISAPNATTFTAALLVVTEPITTAGGATSRIDVASLTDATKNDITASTTGILAIHNQVAALNLSAWFGASLKTLIIGGKANASSAAQNNPITITASNSAVNAVTILDTSVISAFTMVDAAAMVTLTTAGAIRDFTVGSMAAFDTMVFGHSHIQGTGSDAATIVVTNTAVTSLDLSSMKKVKTITVIGNTSLATITAPNPTDEQGFAEPSATISITITGNALTGAYTPAQDGTEVTDHVASSLTAAAVTSFKAYIDKFTDAAIAVGNARTAVAANIATTPVSNAATGAYIPKLAFNIGLDSVDTVGTAATETETLATVLAADNAATLGADDAATSTDDENDEGNITTYNELSLVGSGS